MKGNITKQFLLEKTNSCLNDCKKTGVYKIYHINFPTVFYIGSASSTKRWREGFLDRWVKHCHKLNKNTHNSIYLQRVVNKYGIDGLRFEIIEFCNPEECLKKEQIWLDFFQPFGNKGYNTCKIAGSSLGIKINSDKNCIKVCQFNLKGKFIKTYKSLTFAAKLNKIHVSDIKECCKKRIRYSGGYQWRYFDEVYEKDIENIENIRLFKISCYYNGKLKFNGDIKKILEITKCNKSEIYDCINKNKKDTYTGWLFRKYTECEEKNIEYTLKKKYCFTLEDSNNTIIYFNSLASLCKYLKVSRRKFDKELKEDHNINYENYKIKKIII